MSMTGLRFVATRARTNTLSATNYDLKIFLSVVGKKNGTGHCSRWVGVQAAPAGSSPQARVSGWRSACQPAQ